MKLLIDGFTQYVDGKDVQRVYDTVPEPIIRKGTGPGGSTGLRSRSSTTTNPFPIKRDIAPSQHVAASFHIETNTGGRNFSFGLSSAGSYDRQPNAGPLISIEIVSTNAECTAYYRIPNGPTGTAANSLVLGSFAGLLPSTTYLFDIEIDHRDEDATLKLWRNGELVINATYLRDRINNGHQAVDFAEFTLATGQYTNAATIYNLVVFVPDDDDISPLGDHRIIDLKPANAALSIDPANDATGVTVDNRAWTDFNLSEVPDGAEVLGAALHYRLGAVGTSAAVAEVALEASGALVGDIRRHDITPGLTPQLHTSILPPSALIAPRLRVRSAGGG